MLMSKARSKQSQLSQQLDPKNNMHWHTVDQGITLWEAQPNNPTIEGACDMYNAELFSEVSQQKKVQESCLPPEVTRESRNACAGVSVAQL